MLSRLYNYAIPYALLCVAILFPPPTHSQAMPEAASRNIMPPSPSNLGYQKKIVPRGMIRPNEIDESTQITALQNRVRSLEAVVEQQNRLIDLYKKKIGELQSHAEAQR